MVKRSPIWVRLIAGAAFVYAWVMIVYTPPKHRHAVHLKEGVGEKQQLINDVDNLATTTNNEATVADTLTKASVTTTPKAAPTINTAIGVDNLSEDSVSAAPKEAPTINTAIAADTVSEASISAVSKAAPTINTQIAADILKETSVVAASKVEPTTNMAVAADTLTEASLAAAPKAIPTTNTFLNGGISDTESAKEKPSKKKPEMTGADKNVLDKQLEGFLSDRKQQIQNQSHLSKITSDRLNSQTNKKEFPNAKSTVQEATVVQQIKEMETMSQDVPSNRQDIPQINKNHLLNIQSSSEPAETSESVTPVKVQSVDPENKSSHHSEADNYPEPHDVSILPPGVCPRGDVVTVIGGGRLANCIWEYVTVWSLSRFLPGNRAPFAQKLIVNTLSKVFDGVNLPTVEDLPKDCECCKSTNWTAGNVQVFDFIPLNNVTTRFANFKGHIILTRYSLLLEPVLATIEQLKKEFRYKYELVISAQNVIRNKTALYMKLTKTMDKTGIVYVGVHVRRTDYIKYLSETHNMTATGPEYFNAAMNYFRKRTDLGKPIFLVVSDDVSWVETNLKGNDVFVVSKGGIDNPGYDIALLSHCNHSIIDYGTYGLWAAVYAGGETITMKTTTQVHRILSKKTNWHFVKTSSTGEIIIP